MARGSRIHVPGASHPRSLRCSGSALVPDRMNKQDERDGTEAQRAAMVAYTRALIRQGGPENPWEGLATRQRRRGCWRLWKQAEQRPEMRWFASRRQRALISDRWTRVGFAVFARGACTGHGISGPSRRHPWPQTPATVNWRWVTPLLHPRRRFATTGRS